MESPIIIVDGGGITEGSLLGADSGFAAAAGEGHSEGALADSVGVPPALTGETGPAEPLLDTASLNSWCREDDEDVGIRFPGCSPSGGKSCMPKISNLLASGKSWDDGEGGRHGRAVQHLSLCTAAQGSGWHGVEFSG
ncbi:Hypothetical predicted protein [Xyrichtys novacula]|nr:Hypothetical predicted protein [Xyrichtys novacula]